jgi:hypothetical protein
VPHSDIRMRSSRLRNASIIELIPSPTIPKAWVAPQAISVSTMIFGSRQLRPELRRGLGNDVFGVLGRRCRCRGLRACCGYAGAGGDHLKEVSPRESGTGRGYGRHRVTSVSLDQNVGRAAWFLVLKAMARAVLGGSNDDGGPALLAGRSSLLDEMRHVRSWLAPAFSGFASLQDAADPLGARAQRFRGLRRRSLPPSISGDSVVICPAGRRRSENGAPGIGGGRL